MVDPVRAPVKAFALIALNLVVLFFQPTFQQSTFERAALLQLRSDLGIRSREWPRKADPCSGWIGIQCDNGSVVGINISGFRRTRLGSLNPQFAVDSLANFTRLTSFNASRFLLPGSIPDSFGQTVSSSLQFLDLTSCSITNAVPASLGSLSGLVGLHLGDNRLTGVIPSSLSQLLQLSVLNLSRNLFTGSVPPVLFSSLVNLTSLDMSSNFFVGSIPPIGELSRIRYFNLSNNSFSSVPAQLGSLVNLVDLDLTRNSLTGGLPVELSGLTNLRSLLLGDNLISGSLPTGLFTNQSQLENVVLSNNDFTGTVPRELFTIPGLRVLDISDNNFTGMLPDGISNSNSTNAVLNISGNQFYGGLVPVLGRFGFVDLTGNYFQGPVPGFVRNKASISSNCLRNVTNQKSLFDCSSFYSDRGLVFDNFGLPNSTQPGVQTSRKSKRNFIILVSVLGGLGLLLLILFIGLLIFCLRKRDTSNQRGVAVEPPTQGTAAPPPPEASINFSILGDTFTYQQLLQATGEFNDANLIKHGHSGDIYRGILENGIHVAIKRIDLTVIKKESYLVELDFFSKVANAPKVVPLLGHCLENQNEKFLVYKYMPNEDLASSLFRKTSSEDDTLKSLDWITRLKIAIGAAEALSCLHHECTPPIVHRDIQASSILLDDKFEVRLGSLSEVCAQEGDAHQSRRITRLLRLPSSDQGTSGQPTATCSYDVYCFGKVLLELVTGNLGISAANDAQLKDSLDQIIPHISMYEKELVVKIIDPSLIIDEDLLEEVWAMAIVARSCLNPKPSRRPLMRYILKALENPLKVVREETADSSARLRTTSSRGSWNAAVFSSWRQSSDVAVVPPPAASSSRPEGGGSFKSNSQSQGSGRNGSGDRSSSSHRRQSRDVFPEPGEGVQDIERQEHD